ncbi:uncharacterized protein PADG_02044 [Paracoccidioides brasiliensis Pb18]|uniref:Uncharacterized protein n=1 Tax=Paracoccidioides brasiliensis (strain Pb18) TaxID=502780 RepID=C1G528_PARBD|nr:uncharacterized protein PADG_02044 [Paracoccidioides brasiliensis Pb18]EEH45894.2 hypothetical protein PADG_02044 [Paracoccidioides brasiliensis Pb18]
MPHKLKNCISCRILPPHCDKTQRSVAVDWDEAGELTCSSFCQDKCVNERLEMQETGRPRSWRKAQSRSDETSTALTRDLASQAARDLASPYGALNQTGEITERRYITINYYYYTRDIGHHIFIADGPPSTTKECSHCLETMAELSKDAPYENSKGREILSKCGGSFVYAFFHV